MNNSKLFTLAHKLTKKVIKAGDNYRVTFGAAIKVVKAAYFGKTVATLKSWKKNGLERIYINFEIPCTRFGGMTDAKAGFIEVMKDFTLSFENVAEEYRSRIESAIQAKAVFHQVNECDAISQSINF